MFAGLILLIVLGGVSCLTTTPQGRAEARANVARWNPLFISIILIGLAIMLYPWPHVAQTY